MPFAITGAKYASASVSTVGTTTVTVGTTPFVSGDFASTRLLGLWSAAGAFKGMAWARRFVSTSQVELQTEFFDPATGATVAQVVGDQVLVSKNFAESVVAGLTVSNRTVTITDSCTFGSPGNQLGVCFYDENKEISTTSAISFSGGLTVFGRMEDYATTRVASSCDVFSTQAASQSLFNVANTSAHFVMNGGSLSSLNGPIYVGSSGTSPLTYIFNKVQSAVDLLASAAGLWGANAARCQLVGCTSITAATNAIMVRWRNGVVRGGNYRVANNSAGPISVFGDDNPGTYNISAPPGQRLIVADVGSRAALVRSSGTPVVTFNFTNLITPDYRATSGAGTPLVANGNGTCNFSFADEYTGLVAGSVGVVTLDADGSVVDSTASSGASWAPPLLRRRYVGATESFVRGPWSYGIKRYGYDPVSGAIAASTYSLGPVGDADNVMFGGAVTQLADSKVTLSQSAALALSSKITAATGSPGTITVTANATLDEVYDYLIAWNCSSVALAQFPSLSAYPVTSSGLQLVTAMNIVVGAGATLSAGTKFTSFSTTGTVTINGAISAPYTDASGTRVTIKTSDNLPLSTYLTVDGTPQAWQVGQTARNIFVGPASVVRIYAHAYGYQPRIVNVTGNTASDYVINLTPETNVDTTLDTTTRGTIAGALGVGVDAFSRIFLSVSADLRTYTPAQVLNALHYFTVTQGSLIAAASVQANSVDGFALQLGGFAIRSPGFYGKVDDSVTAPTNLGILVPLAISVDPSVYLAVPTYTPVELNASGVPLQYAPWTQQTASISALDKSDIRNGLAREATVESVPAGVRTELATELARVDATVSSREAEADAATRQAATLAAVAAIPAAPAATDIADAVWAKELP